MASFSPSLCSLTILTFLTFSWLYTCFGKPYWKTIEAPDKNNLSILLKAVPEIQKPLNVATGVFSSFSIDIGVLDTCINGHFCSQHNQLRKLFPSIKFPVEKNILMFVLGLSLLVVAFIFSILLVCCQNSYLFCFLTVFLFLSLFMLVIATIGLLFTIKTFNNWAAFGFIIGTIFVFILLLNNCLLWKEYKKDQRVRSTPSPETSESTISMMA